MSLPTIVDLNGTEPGSRELLGGKAYSVNKMRALGLRVPPAFALTTPLCAQYHENNGSLTDDLWTEVLEHLSRLEHETGRTFGVGPFPLLVSVRSGAAQSMPGMMDTVLNLGLTESLRDELGAATGDEAWAQNTWTRFRESYTSIVGPVPADPYEQLRNAIGAVFDSWNNERVAAYRSRHGLGAGKGTAVTIQAMVFGNRDERSGTGVLFSRNPSSGENVLFGEWLAQAQGEDVVSGERTPSPLSHLREAMPHHFAELERIASVLEKDHRDLVDIEFTIEGDVLYVLQCRKGKRSAAAAVQVAVDLVHAGVISRPEALARITTEHVRSLEDNDGIAAGAPVVAQGNGASPGTATGVAVTDTEEAQNLAAEGVSVVLVRPSTAPDDVPAMFESVAVVTEVGGSTSHAALVCREIGLSCVVGCGPGTVAALQGRTITVDGASGKIYEGNVLEAGTQTHAALTELLTWLPDPLPADHHLASVTRRPLESA
ncbi:MAG: pyruvate, phosphate dikinase [Rhodococcus sp. (in: high G+C Gram-positive bacteria)]|uniref:pyruvate, phosphate dikinase n=1 Tax=Rhodococcus sp. EPR-157 TaxID=1813677 RepID=UPI0007BC82B0|nr:pyruvate, phosphate dikinase [Rhodococcus sp. EPR-157]KZF12445.1 pyruvate, phosphate dikinase [Rhodococcus sp. EPR-157]